MTTTAERTIAQLLEERRGVDYATTVADTIGVSRQIYAQWESGHALPGEEFIPAIANHLDVDEEWLALKRYREKLARLAKSNRAKGL